MEAILLAAILTLTNQFGSVRIDTRGARVLSYVPRGGTEVFATFADGSGGMPICAPFFASLGPKGARRHGPARYQDFRVRRRRDNDDTSSVELVVASDESTRGEFPYDYRVSINYRLSRTLSARMTVANVGSAPMPVTPAFHPYFRVGDAARCRVDGIDVSPSAVAPGPSRLFRFPSGRRTFSLVDPALRRTLEFVSAGDAEAVVWTPGDAPSPESLVKMTSTFRPGEWRTFVAVENGLLSRESEVTLAPGESRTLVRTIRDVECFPYGPNETALWQGRIDAAASSGGGTVVVPAGEHTVAQLKLKSGVALHLEKGAVLAASTDYADHPSIPGENRGAVVWAEDADGIAIEGEGTIDGRGGDMPVVDKIDGRWRGIHFLRCTNVRLEDLTLRDAHSWGCYLRECDGVTVRRMKIRNRMNLNNDGIDIASKNVLVEDCDIDAEDDGLVFKNHNPDFVVENVKVRNCRISSATSFIKVGTETWGGFRNIDVRGCVCDLTSPAHVRDSRRSLRNAGCDTLWTGSDGIALETVDGGFLEDVTVADITMRRGVFVPLFVRLDNRAGHADGRDSYLRNVLVENVTMESPAVSWYPCSVTGSAGLRPSDVTVRNCTFRMRACPRAADLMREAVPEQSGLYPAGSMFRVVTPAYGAYVRHADRISFEDVRFDLGGEADARRETHLDDVSTQVVIRASARWTPVANEVEIEPGSALDFSKLCGESSPAGTWGRVVARDGHFEFERRPGESVRFYGVNVCTGANYLEPEVAERFAETLRRRGYNALRLHHHDGGLVDGAADTAEPSPERFAQLDALVAACAKRGIYLSTDLYVSRPVSFRALGIDRKGSAKGFPFKELVLFHSGAQSNYFAFARAFLGHRNPLTGRTYAEEPALAWISLVNEGNSGHHGANYFREFPGGEETWRNWLARRKAEDPAHYGKIPEALPTNTWSRTSAHNAAFSLFVTDLEIAFDAKAKRFLREEMGCQALVTSINGGCNPPCYQLARQANFDYVDDHFYIDSRQFLAKRWELPSRQHNRVPFVTTDKKGCDLGVRGTVFRRLFDRPFTVSEYNFVGVNDHRGVSGILTGSLAARQGWAGLWRFAWSHGDTGILHPEQVLARGFDLCGDIANRATERAVVCLFRRGDMSALTRDLPWVLPEKALRVPTRFSPYVPPKWSGAAWWCRLGTVVADAAPPTAWKSVMYEDAYRVTRRELVGDLSRQDDGVRIRYEDRVFAVNTPRTCGIFAPRGRYAAGPLTVDFGSDEATVWASSLDGRPLATSGRVLVSHVTDVKNSGITFADPARTTLIAEGALPLLMRVGTARVMLGTSSGTWRVWRLASSGRRLEEIPASVENGSLVFDLSTARGTIHYELAHD